MSINNLYNELVDSLDDFKSLLKKPSMRSPEIVQQLLLLTAELVKACELDRRGETDCLPNNLTGGIEESRVALKQWLDALKAPSTGTPVPKHYIKKFAIHESEINRIGAKLVYRWVLPVFEEGEAPAGFTPEGSCFLYEDYSSLLKPGDTFHEIVLIEVEEPYRRRGIGTQLVKDFFEACNPTSVILRAGITRKELYEQLCAEDCLADYIYENIVPFYEKLGFTDVNNTVFCFEETVPMLWPKSKADEARKKSDAFKQKNLQEQTTSYFR